MKLPCEIIVWNVLPAIRAAIAEELIKCGVSQRETALLLKMAPSAISQYISGKRGYRIIFEGEIKESISLIARDLQENRVDDLSARICGICTILREKNPNMGSCVNVITSEEDRKTC